MAKDEFRENINTVSTRKFLSMNSGEKLAYLCKVIVFLISFGFAFPNIFSED
jgi:hypothetical protein